METKNDKPQDKNTNNHPKKSNKLRLGIFITAGAIIFIGLIYYIGQKQWLFTPTIHVTAYFSDVTGLQIGNKVRFTGYNVGSVSDISIVSDTSAKVELIIAKKATTYIRNDAIAIIGSEGLMGSKVINIGPGTKGNRNIKDLDILKTQEPTSLDDILAQIEITSLNASYITEDLAAITGKIRSGQGVIGKLLVDSAYAEDIGQTLTNVRNSTKGINELVPAVKHNFLLRGYYKKQQKQADKKVEEERKKAAADSTKARKNK